MLCPPANETHARLPSKDIEAEDDPAEESEWLLVQTPGTKVVHKMPWDVQLSPKFSHRPSLFPSSDWLATPDEVTARPEPEPEPEPQPEPEPEPLPEPGFKLPKPVIKEASEFGVEQMLQLYNVTEPQLHKDGLFLLKKSPGALVASFNYQAGRALPLARYAHATLHASEHLRASLFRLAQNKFLFLLPH